MTKLRFILISFSALSGLFSAYADESRATVSWEENIILMKPKPLPSADQLRNRTKNGTTNRSAPKSCGSCCYSVVSAVGYDLNPFYGKVVEVDGFVIASSAAVSDDALYEAALTFAKMTEGRPDLVTNLIKEGVHLAVIGKDEVLTDIPEYSILDSSSWDWARGVGATQWIPVTSCAEENLLCLDDDAYRGENICIHETAHSLQGSGGKLPLPRTIELNGSDDLDQALRALYTQAVEVDKLWAGEYSATNHEEYWAEGVQSFYDANIFTSANTRAELQSYDNGLYSIISRVFPADVTLTCPTSSQCDCSSFSCPRTQTPCQDSEIDFVYRKKFRSCNWLAQSKKKEKLCRKKALQKMCPFTCGKCSEYACNDAPKRFNVNNESRKCKWVRKNPENRCQEDGVRTTCRKTCGFCD
mmetsp:Transcript_1490/g.3847  ORF Transcript_1490/g.3847 Transcript_1490/m.3847 type:complete len:414 (+) Transcript_1490:305-1546(+)